MKTLYRQPVKGSGKPLPNSDRALPQAPGLLLTRLAHQRLPVQMALGHGRRIFSTAGDKARHFGPPGGLSGVAVANVEAPGHTVGAVVKGALHGVVLKHSRAPGWQQRQHPPAGRHWFIWDLLFGNRLFVRHNAESVTADDDLQAAFPRQWRPVGPRNSHKGVLDLAAEKGDILVPYHFGLTRHLGP